MDPTTFIMMMRSASAAPLLPVTIGTITFNSSVNSSSTTTSVPVTVPASSISSDYHFVTIASSVAREVSATPAGWQKLCEVREGATSSRLYVFYVTGLVGTSTVTFTMDGAGNFPNNITSVRGMTVAPTQLNKVSGQPTSSAQVPAQLTGTSSTSITVPGQPSAVAGNAEFLIFSQDDQVATDNDFVLPATATDIAYNSVSGSRSFKVGASGPQTTDQTATSPENRASIGVSVLLK